MSELEELKDLQEMLKTCVENMNAKSDFGLQLVTPTLNLGDAGVCGDRGEGGEVYSGVLPEGGRAVVGGENGAACVTCRSSRSPRELSPSSCAPPKTPGLPISEESIRGMQMPRATVEWRAQRTWPSESAVSRSLPSSSPKLARVW
eukprot:TRINITY_DN14893_c0_g1_i16.p1 TRINITY_DN14893_c0_g1~~TRINITY_DN14893_c0_g1_i16.p1  ORF type:complete len:146 (-),score=2.69 TRINITY_DN14893_c0_g1_i16:339-776(-)